MPDTDVVLMTRASFVAPAFARSRQYTAAWCVGAKVPFRWTRITASHSSSVIVKIIRSRRIPALLTSTSRPPNRSTACRTSAAAPSNDDTSASLAAATPPAAVISSTTAWAGPASPPLPSRAPPKSFTSTWAPCAASSSACSRPMPRPAPVTMHTRP